MLLTPLCILVNGEGSRLATSECTVWAWWTAAAAYGYLTAFCGMSFRPDGMGLILNQTRWDSCSDQVSASHVVNAAVPFARDPFRKLRRVDHIRQSLPTWQHCW